MLVLEILQFQSSFTHFDSEVQYSVLESQLFLRNINSSECV